MDTATSLPAETVFRALADSTRLRILNLLREGELCVCDLVAVLEVPQPTASRHLAYLRKTGLVDVRQEGQWHYYRLSPARTSFQRRIQDCVAACVDVNPELNRDLTRLRALGSSC